MARPATLAVAALLLAPASLGMRVLSSRSSSERNATHGLVKCCCKVSTRRQCVIRDAMKSRPYYFVPQAPCGPDLCCLMKDWCGPSFFSGYEKAPVSFCLPPPAPEREQAPMEKERRPCGDQQPRPQPREQPPLNPLRQFHEPCSRCEQEMCADDGLREEHCRQVTGVFCPVCRADQRWAAASGLRLVEVPRDNNCLYHAIGECTGKDHRTVRKEIAQAMSSEGIRDLLRQDPRAWETIATTILDKGFLTDPEQLQVLETRNAAYSRYVKDMIAKEGTWGTDDSIYVASLIYDASFQVVRCFYDTCVELEEDMYGDGGAVHKLVFFANHWNVVV